VRIEVGREVQEVRIPGQLSVQDRVMMSADIIGNVTVEDIGEDQGRGAIACSFVSCHPPERGDERWIGVVAPTTTVSTHRGGSRAIPG
jgi:hypothetical protein